MSLCAADASPQTTAFSIGRWGFTRSPRGGLATTPMVSLSLIKTTGSHGLSVAMPTAGNYSWLRSKPKRAREAFGYLHPACPTPTSWTATLRIVAWALAGQQIPMAWALESDAIPVAPLLCPRAALVTPTMTAPQHDLKTPALRRRFKSVQRKPYLMAARLPARQIIWCPFGIVPVKCDAWCR